MPKQKTAKKPKRFVVDEVHVQIVIRELDASGETVAKHTAETIRFVNEGAFREWAAKPFNFVDERDATAE